MIRDELKKTMQLKRGVGGTFLYTGNPSPGREYVIQ
jgi:hypothetical protein